jgi:hypothetical protein
LVSIYELNFELVVLYCTNKCNVCLSIGAVDRHTLHLLVQYKSRPLRGFNTRVLIRLRTLIANLAKKGTKAQNARFGGYM